MRLRVWTVVVALGTFSRVGVADGVSDRQLRRAIRGAGADQVSALVAAEEAHRAAEVTLRESAEGVATARLAHEAALLRVDHANVGLLAIDAERAWAESSEDRGRLAALFSERREAAKELTWRQAQAEVARLSLLAAEQAEGLRTAELATRSGVLELVRLRTFVDLEGSDEALEKQIGELQGALGRAEVLRHESELLLERTVSAVTQAEVQVERLAP